jgi:hypothetical protein
MMVLIKEVILTVEINMKIRKLILRIIIAIILLYGVYLLWAVYAFGGGCKHMNAETHILPADYIGMVYIIFNQKDGYPKNYGNGRSRLYTIPKSGVLKTQFKGNFGWIDAGENINFYCSKNDSLIKLQKLITEREVNSDLDSNQVVVFEYGYGGAKSNFGLNEDVLTYIVDSLKNISKRDYSLTKERFENWDK